MDQYMDALNLDLVKIANKLSSTEFIDDFDLSTPEQLNKLASHDFAWPEVRLFPTDSPQNTLISGLFLLEKRNQLNEEQFETIKANIVKAASLHGVADVLLKHAAEILHEDKEHKADVTDKDYALVAEHQGKTVRLYPLKNAAQVRAAQTHFEKNWSKYPVDWRKTIAQRICDEACTHKVKLSSNKVQEYAGIPRTNFIKAGECIAERIRYCAPTYIPLYRDIVKSLEKQAEFNTDIETFADALTRLDEHTGMDILAKKGYFPDARASIYNEPLLKEGAAPIKIDGKDFDTDDLANTPLEVYVAALGKEFVPAVTDGVGKLDVVKLYDIIPTLPKPDQALLALAISKHWKARPENPGSKDHEAYEPNPHPGGFYGSK